jgi:hypothetical protein
LVPGLANKVDNEYKRLRKDKERGNKRAKRITKTYGKTPTRKKGQQTTK